MELSKLATFVSPRHEILLDEVEALIGSSRMEKVFGITDAIARRDARGAIALWEQVLSSDRDAAYRSVGGLAFGFRKLAEAKRMVAQGASIAEAKSRVKLFGDVSGLGRQLKRFSLPQWQDHLVTLLRIDVGSKTGLGKVQTSVEKLIVDLCAAS